MTTKSMDAYTTYLARVEDAMGLLDEIEAALLADTNAVIIAEQAGVRLDNWSRAGSAGHIIEQLIEISDHVRSFGPVAE